jgi:hypothetical protein
VKTGDKSKWVLEAYYYTGITFPDAKTGVWVKAKGARIGCGKYKYPHGFHAYAKKPKHRANGIPVKFRRIHTIGTQSGEKVIVAYEMMIPKNWRKYVR